MPPRLPNKICLITGTGGSMGRAAALKFALEGATIVGCDINPVTDAETVSLVQSLHGTSSITSLSPCDLTKEADCKALVAFAITKHGRIDVLYNNAAMAYFEPMDTITPDTWYKTIDQELNLVFLLTRVAWPHLKSSRGAVINVGSVNGYIGLPSLPALAHVAAKGGVLAMTRQLAMEGRGDGVRVNSITPGAIETRQTAPMMQDREWAEGMVGKVMLGRFGRPEEVVNVACFLASGEASYVTGADFRVDGGMTAW